MPTQLSAEENQARKKVYRQQYYQKHQGRYAASYQKKREGTYLCNTCNKVLKIVSKSAHEKTQKHVYAYYRAGFNGDPAGDHGGDQSAESKGEGPLRQEQGENEAERSSEEE